MDNTQTHTNIHQIKIRQIPNHTEIPAKKPSHDCHHHTGDVQKESEIEIHRLQNKYRPFIGIPRNPTSCFQNYTNAIKFYGHYTHTNLNTTNKN